MSNSGSLREEMGREELQVLCFETETERIRQAFPCLPNRGIANYADSLKNNKWKRSAATAYARGLLKKKILPLLIAPYQKTPP
jgi:hypothetical protein